MDVRWDIRREGRSDERLALLGLLLENVGADAAVKLGDPNVWIGAALNRPRGFLGDPFNRVMLVLLLLTPVVLIGGTWLLTVVPVPRTTLLVVLTSALVALGVSALANAFLRD